VNNIEIPKKQAKPRKTLNSEELAKLFKQLERSRWIWSAKFMLVTGARRGELLALRWSDIDFINKRVTTDESDSATGLDDTKSSKVHYVPLSPLMEKYLQGQKQMLEDEVNPILHNDELKKTDLIFPNKGGKMLQPGSYYTMLARAAEKAGLHASPHCLRHTFVYRNRKKLSLKEIQNILGHDESTTTLDIYGDMLDESTEQTAKTIDESFADLEDSIEKLKKKESAKIIDFSQRKKIGG
jgi:integrase